MKKKTLDLKAVVKRISVFLTHNWQWKLLSLILAVCLWSGLITQDETLTREKVFSDVVINVTNADTLRRNGFIIVSGLDDLPTVRVSADVPQKNYNSVSASNYNLRIDLSRIRSTGEQTLQRILKSRSNVKIETNRKIVGVEANDGGLTGVTVENRLTGERRTIPSDGLFIAIGLIPENGPFEALADLNQYGYFASGEDCLTRTPGVYVAGDCRSKSIRQLTTACADGAVAALAACRYINERK